jgi:hypothetical protein
MWVFYALAGPIALGMVVATLQYFAASTVPLHVRWIVGYAWFCTISIIILVPADIWTVRKNTHHHHHYYLLLCRPHPSLQFPFLLSPSLSAIPFSVVPISLQFPSLMPPTSLWNSLLCCPHLFLQLPSLLPPISVSVSVPSLLVVEIFSLCKFCRWYCLCFCREFLSLESQPYGSACLLAEHPKKTLVGCCGCMQTVSPENGSSKTIGILWSWSYWSTFILTWYVSGMVSSLFWLFLLMVHNSHKQCV